MENSYSVSAFKAEINILTKKKKTTVPETRKTIELLTAATSHRHIFHAKGGVHLTSEDVFRAAKITSNNTKIKELEDKEKSSGKMKS